MCKYLIVSIITVIFLFLPSSNLSAQSVTEKVEYDTHRELYILRHIDIFGRDVQFPRVFSRQEWMDYLLFSKEVKQNTLPSVPTDTVANEKGIHLNMDSPFLKNIFGGTEVKILPKGTLEGGVGVSYTTMDNPLLSERARRHTSFDLAQAVGLDVIGTVGKKVTLKGRVSSSDGFFSGESFTLTYTGDKHEILQKLTVGQVNIASSSPYFSKTTDAFGVTATARVGRVWVDAFFAQKKDMAVVSSFDQKATNNTITASDYLHRRVFSLSKYFVENYSIFLDKYPMINSPIRITQIEVWVGGESSSNTSAQSIFALTDLAEVIPYNTNVKSYNEYIFPNNGANELYSLVKTSQNVEALPIGMTADDDYLLVDNARLLSPAEYTIHPTLGYIILKNALGEGECLAVAYRYVANGKTYTVGEFSTEKIDTKSPLITKLITPTHTLPEKKSWIQMMKNAYSVSSAQGIEILFYDDEKAGNVSVVRGKTPYAGRKISWLVGADRLNAHNDATADNAGDGYVDAVEGVTFFHDEAVLVFPTLYPFACGADSVLLKDEFLKSKYSYSSLYTKVKTVAQDDISKNKYIITTHQTVASDDVFQNDTPQLLKSESGTSTRMAGIGIRYYPDEKTSLYASLVNATAVRKSQKNYINDVSTSKTQIAIGAKYSTDASWLTRWADALSAQRLTAQSRITLKGDAMVQVEKTRSSSTISGENAVLIDDFEVKGTGEDLSSAHAWVMCSTPMSSPFVAVDRSNPLAFNYKRASVSWYTIDPIFYGNDSRTPDNIRQDRSLTSKDEVRRVYSKEIFPMEDTPENSTVDMPTLDMYYRPSYRGAYNVNYSAMGEDGELRCSPIENWGGVMRHITQTDVQGNGFSNIHIWVMYPYGKDVDKNRQYGRLVIDVGDISEDVFSLGEKFDESDVNTSELKKKDTAYGYSPYNTSVVTSFSADEAVLRLQDVGLNGMDNVAEAKKYDVGSFFSTSSAVYQDPAGDDYRYFKSALWDTQGADILTRYTRYNNTQGNTSGITQPTENYSVRATGAADAMDYNRDGVLSTAENYSAFVVDLSPDSLLCVGKNYVTTVQRTSVKRYDGVVDSVAWIQLKIPLSSPDYNVGSGMNPSAVSTMRMYFSGVEKPLVWRMAVLELEKNDWKVYPTGDVTEKNITVSSVSVVKNSSRTPIPYIPPEKVNRERVRSGLNSHYEDEASLSFTAKNVPSGAFGWVYRNVQYDMHGAHSIRMYVHSEAVESSYDVKDDDFYSVLRFGGDNTENYYQVAQQLRPTQWGAIAAEQIWQEENEINVKLSEFTEVKKRRDEKIMNKIHPDAHTPYTETLNGKEITVCGYPSVAMVRTVMIGVHNVSTSSKSVCMWADELRVDVDKKRIGWAGEASLAFNMSSLASFETSMGYLSNGMNAGKYSSVWYKVGVVVNTGFLLPEKWKVMMPISFSVGKWIKTPAYSGDMSDVKYDHTNEKTQSFLRTESKTTALDVSLAFAAREGLRAKLWSASNFSASYAFASTRMNDFYTQDYVLRSHLFSAGYNYINSGGFFSPFSKSKKQWPKNISMKPLPSSLYFKIQAKRYDVSSSMRYFADENTAEAFSFLWDYTVGYNAGFVFYLTKNLKLSFSATGSGVVDIVGPTSSEQKRSALTDVFSTGRTTAYHQRTQVGYRLPFHFFSATDWIDIKTQYTADFYWRAGSTSVFYDDKGCEMFLGNTVQNASTLTVIAGFDFLRCFSKDVKQDGTALAVQRGKKYPWGMGNVIKRADVSYRYTEGTLLPGYMGEAGFMGTSALGALGWNFMMGRQTDVLRRAFLHGEITLSGEYLSEQVAHKKASVWSYSVNLEPAPHLLINLKGGKEENRTTLNSFSTEYDPVTRSYNLNIGKNHTSGCMNVSRWAWRSSFDSNDEKNSVTMNRMRTLMPCVAEKLAQKYGIAAVREDGFPIGLPSNHPEVLTYSFLGAYFGGGENAGYNLFNKVPLPEISVEYAGIGFLPAVRDVFSSVRLWSKYSAWYSINDFSTNELWGSTVGSDMFPQQYVFSSVNVVEAFAPLVGVEVKMKNGLRSFFSYTRDRMVSLSVASSRVSQTVGTSYSFGGSAVVAKKWTLGADAVLRKNYTTIFNACDKDSQVSSGERFTSVKCSVGYSLGKNLNLGFTIYALFRGYMLPQMPTTFSTTGTFNVKYNIGE